MNIYAANIIIALVAALTGYLLGGIPTGVIIGKAFFRKDPRDYYSHNSGGTNSGRVLGKKIGVLVILIDAIKAILALYGVWAVLMFTPLRQFTLWSNGYDAAPLYYWLAGLAAAIGHCYPLYIHFKGGKAVSCFVGISAWVSWLEFIVCFGFFFGFLFKKKMVSLGSIVMGIVGSVTMWILAIVQATTGFSTRIFSWDFGASPVTFPVLGFEAAIVLTIAAVLIIVRHAANIKRLRQGTESKVTWIK